MRFPGNHYGKVSVGEMCFCEDSRAKPNHMACAHFPEKKRTDYNVNIVRLKIRYEWPYVFKGEHHIMLLKHLLKRYDFLRQGTTLRAYANRKQTRSG